MMRSNGWRSRQLTRRDFLLTSMGAGAGLVLLGGCSESESTGANEQVQLSFANWISAEDATKENVEKVLAAFRDENPNIQVENIPVPFDQMRQQLLTLNAGGNPPDVQMLIGFWSQELGSQGPLQPLQSLAGEDYIEKNNESAIEAGRYEDELYAVPLSLIPFGFWYNKDLMEQAGLDPEQPPDTMDELNQHMARIKEKLGGQGVFPIGIDTTKVEVALSHFWPWFFAHNARPLYGGEVNFDTPEVANALTWLRKLATEDHTPVGQQVKEERELMAKDRIVYKLDFPGVKGVYRSLNPDLEGDAFYEKFGVTTVPVGANGETETLANLHQLGISARSENREAAWEFARFFISSDASVEQYQIPSGVIPALKEDQKREEFSDPVSQAFVNEIIPSMVSGPYGPDYPKAQEFLLQAMQQAALTQEPIGQILQNTEESLKAVYDGLG